MSDTAKSAPDSARTTLAVVTAIFLILAIALAALVGTYWTAWLQPRLRAEAVSQAEILARSQATFLANALRAADGPERVRRVIGALDELLLLRDPKSETAYFERIELAIDYDAVQADRGSLDLRRGVKTPRGFRTEVALYDPSTYELLGIATFDVSDRFFQQFSGDVRRELLAVTGAVLALLALVWGALVMILRKLHRQRAERDHAQRELFEQEQKYHRLVNSLSSYFVYGRDPDGRVTFISNAASRVVGLPSPELMQQLQQCLAKVAIARDAGERTYEIELTDGDGVLHHLELSEVRGAEGFEGIARDITSQRMVQEELRHAKEQAEAANRAKSQFLANMSHEIRTPLNAILGMTALATKQELAPKTAEYLDKIRSSSRLLADIIEDILDLSRIEAGRLEIERVDFDLDELLGDLSDVVGMRAGQKNLEILFSTSPDVPRRLRGDPVRLKQVLLNLLNNALKFTTRGEIVVEIAPVEVRRDHAEIRFSVRDTGIGIPAEHLPSLFEPFTQVDASLARKFGGAGLGLAISRRLVQVMGGDLDVESTPGVGTTFSFSADFDVPRGPSGPRRLADEFRDLPVLVADDNASARTVLSTMLRSLSCRVTAVASGDEAVAEATRAAEQGRPYRLAVLDWKMPGLDGAEAAAALARHLRSPRVPVILVTAYEREYASRASQEPSIDAVLHKPVSPSALHDAVASVLEPGEHPVRHRSENTGLRFQPGRRVLLVEDNEINRQVARELLTIAGLGVVEAQNGYQALDLLATEKFDAVLMDVQMPELDGIETVTRVRAQEHLRTLPVIAMTAHAMLGDRERFLAAGMTDYISKPISESQLLGVLGRWIDTRVDTSPPRPRTGSGSSSELPEVLPGLHVGDGLRRASGNVALYRRLVVELRREIDAAIPRLHALIEGSATQELLDLLHTLKGSAATIGARRVADEAAALEKALRVGQTIHLDALLAAMNEVRDSIADIAEAPAPAAKESSRAESNVKPPVDPQVLPIARRLGDHLKDNNLAAMTTFEELKTMVGSRFADEVQQLEQSLDRLDFDSARAYLAALEAELGVEP